ncbi:MAG: bifunctional phosphoglucose/phosphomannose isomerase [Dehalococcoidia bacterium]|nr:MAG: bifunctional phosphoglucose/phosphomannose isomerase [Dehalococcoidia bacterium]
MSVLDDLAAYKRIDPQGMMDRIRDLPHQCRAAWQEVQALKLPDDYCDIDKVVILGMGGSAIAGDLLGSLVALESPIPIFSHRDYELPLLVDGRTLLIASSYSGNTEEVLSCFERGLGTGAKKVVITGGGKLLTTARANGVPAFVFHYESEPRAALGYGIMPLLAIAQKVDIVADKNEDVDETIAVMIDLATRIDETMPLARNPAKQLAQRLHQRLPVVYSAGILAQVARRWKGQLNETSKMWCFYEELPEANHNAIVGYGLPKEIAGKALVVFLRAPSLHPRVLLRYDLTQTALEEAGVESATVDAEGKSPLAQMMSAILFGDWVSLYLAILNDVEPAPTPPIATLKERLAGR